MFNLVANPDNISSNDKSNIKGSGGFPPYSITANGIGIFVQTDTESGVYTPVITPNTYIVVFWAKDANNALARCSLKIN